MTTATPDLAALLAQLAQALAEQQRQPPTPEPSPAPERVLLTVEEAAERLGIGRSMAFRLIRDGEIGSVQIGRLRRIPASAVNEYAVRLVARQSRNSVA
jgi:excisionase family DNA binding protein